MSYTFCVYIPQLRNQGGSKYHGHEICTLRLYHNGCYPITNNIYVLYKSNIGHCMLPPEHITLVYDINPGWVKMSWPRDMDP